MALLSILRYLFHEAPDILKIFDEFTQLNVFGAVAPVPNMDEGRIASLNSDGAAKVSPLKSVNAVKNALGVNNLNNSNNVPGVASNSKGVTNGINSHPAQGTKRVANDLNIEEDGDGAKVTFFSFFTFLLLVNLTFCFRGIYENLNCVWRLLFIKRFWIFS